MRSVTVTSLALMALASGCAGSHASPNVPSGDAAYHIFPAADGQPVLQDYRIGPLDTVDINVLQEPDISIKGVVVDASGSIVMPLIGRVTASGKTASELSALLEGKLGERYYVHPRVTIIVADLAAQRVTVEGDVTEPGIYPIKGSATLLDTLALAKGETETAAFKDVVVFRFVNRQRMAARFDLKRIRNNEDPDPQILGSDVIVVGHSNGKGFWHDLLKAAPLLNIFRPYSL